MGSQSGGLQFAEQPELRFVKQRAARERVHLLQRHLLFARPQPMDGMQQEAIGARGEVLQRRGRITARGQALGGQHGQRGGVRFHNAIGGVPIDAVAAPVTAQGIGQERIGFDQIAARAGGVHAADRRQIEFRIVDGFASVGGRRPIQARGGALPRALFKRAQIGQASMRRAHDFKRIKRWHTRPRFDRVHARIGEDQAIAGRGAGDAQAAALVGHAIVLHAQAGVQLAAVIVEQDGVFVRDGWETGLRTSPAEIRYRRPARALRRYRPRTRCHSGAGAARGAGIAAGRRARRRLHRASPGPPRPWFAIRQAPTARIRGAVARLRPARQADRSNRPSRRAAAMRRGARSAAVRNFPGF